MAWQLLLAGLFILLAWLTRERIAAMPNGFRRETTLYKLNFEDFADLDGFEVTARAIPLGQFLEINRLMTTLGNEADPDEQVKQSELLFTRFADHLVSWNLEDEAGVPVPATFEGIKTQELPFVQQIIGAWMSVQATVPKPSPTTSNGSGTFPELSVPMEVSLPSPAS